MSSPGPTSLYTLSFGLSFLNSRDTDVFSLCCASRRCRDSIKLDSSSSKEEKRIRARVVRKDHSERARHLRTCLGCLELLAELHKLFLRHFARFGSGKERELARGVT